MVRILVTYGSRRRRCISWKEGQTFLVDLFFLHIIVLKLEVLDRKFLPKYLLAISMAKILYDIIIDKRNDINMWSRKYFGRRRVEASITNKKRPKISHFSPMSCTVKSAPIWRDIDTSQAGSGFIRHMVLISDGNSEIGEHVRRNLYYLIW